MPQTIDAVTDVRYASTNRCKMVHPFFSPPNPNIPTQMVIKPICIQQKHISIRFRIRFDSKITMQPQKYFLSTVSNLFSHTNTCVRVWRSQNSFVQMLRLNYY